MSWRSSVAMARPISRDARQVAEAGAELLDRLELGRPGRHLLEVLGGPDGDAGLGRQGRDRVELVVGPGVRLVVVDVEQAEQLGAVHERRRADRVEALLDDGRPDIGAARVVAVAGREQRSAGGDGRGRQGAASGSRPHRCRGRPADRPRLAAGTVAPSGRRRNTRRAVALEQDHARGRRGRPGSGRGRAGCRCRPRPGAGPRRDGAGARPPPRVGRRR